MSFDRSPEPRRSRSGGRANYSGRRGGRADPRSPDFRRQRRGSYRGLYHASSPEYGGRYRRRSPSGTPYGRERRTYQGGRSAPYRRSRRPSPDHRRSWSADSNPRNRRYLHKDVPSARFGSKASYLRSRDVNRGDSRSRSRICRQTSPSQRSRVERRDGSVRSQSRSRCPGARGEPKEGSRRHYIGRQLWNDRAPDRYEAASCKERKLHEPCSSGKPFAKEHSACRSRSQHSEGRWHFLGEPRARRVASPTRQSSPYDRVSKCSRSGTRSASASRKRIAAMTRGGSMNEERRARRKSRSVDRDRKAARVTDEHLSRRSRSLHRRSSTVSRREGNKKSNRRSLNYDRASFRRSCDGLRRTAGETANRNSPDRGQSPRKPHSNSRGRIAVELSGGSQQPEHHSRRESSRSADCPTPDLVSSRPWKGDDGEQPDMSKRMNCQDKEVAALTSHNDASDPQGSHTSGASDTSENRHEKRPRQRQSGVVLGSPCAPPALSDAEPDTAKESRRGRLRSPRTEEEAATDNDLKRATEAGALTVPCEAFDQEESSGYANALPQKHNESSLKKDDLAVQRDSKKDEGVPLSRRNSKSPPEERVQVEDRCSSDPAPLETPLKSAASRPVGEIMNSSGSSVSGTDVRRKREVRRMVVNRRIVATESRPAGPLSAGIRGMYHALRPSPPKRYYRVQRLFPDRSGRVIPSMDRFRPVNVIVNRWGRFEGEEHLQLACPPFSGNTGRSVRLVGGYNDRNPFFQPYRGRNVTPNEHQRVQLYNDTLDRGGQPYLGAPKMGYGAIMQPSRGRGRRQVRRRNRRCALVVRAFAVG